MNVRQPLINLLQSLLADTMVLHQQGAGYYSCIPIVRRYNKLLDQAASLFPQANGLFSTFQKIDEKDPKDPADKMIVMQELRIEIGQLVTLLQSLSEDTA